MKDVTPNADRPIQSKEDDKYGFHEFSERLAPAIIAASNSEGMVVGIEGRWGSGKTSLLNFLEQELLQQSDHKIHITKLAPWIQGNTDGLIEVLLADLLPILEDNSETDPTWGEQAQFWKNRNQISEVAKTLRHYTQATARSVSPMLKVAGAFVPGVSVAGDILTATAESASGLKLEASAAELKEKVRTLLQSSKTKFVVFLDDLDRIEPSQAVEVIRLVRSVADFPNMVYVLSYDRKVLGHALEHGLQVQNGNEFLQKIVQLTFPMPLLEPFDLRLELSELVFSFLKAQYQDDFITDELSQEIRNAIDSEGGLFKTPREVKLTFNAIKVALNAVGEEIYIPDVCRIQLIKTLRPELYQWIEEYMAIYSAINGGGAQISEADFHRFGKELNKLLPEEEIGSLNSIWHLSHHLPGIEKSKEPEKCVFQKSYGNKIQKWMQQKRIGSPVHFRLYFAFAVPKNLLPEEAINDIVRLAEKPDNQLKFELIKYANDWRPVGGTWLEHILERLSARQRDGFSSSQIRGILFALSQMMDDALIHSTGSRFLGVNTAAHLATELSIGLLRELSERNTQIFRETTQGFFVRGAAVNWLVGHVIRDDFWKPTLLSDSEILENNQVPSSETLQDIRDELARRLAQPDIKERILQLPEISSYIWGWRDITSIETVKDWVQAEVEDGDEKFLKLLWGLRGWVMSDKIYHPIRREVVEIFFDYEETEQRIQRIIETGSDKEIQQLAKNIQAHMQLNSQS